MTHAPGNANLNSTRLENTHGGDIFFKSGDRASNPFQTWQALPLHEGL